MTKEQKAKQRTAPAIVAFIITVAIDIVMMVILGTIEAKTWNSEPGPIQILGWCLFGSAALVLTASVVSGALSSVYALLTGTPLVVDDNYVVSYNIYSGFRLSSFSDNRKQTYRKTRLYLVMSLDELIEISDHQKTSLLFSGRADLPFKVKELGGFKSDFYICRTTLRRILREAESIQTQKPYVELCFEHEEMFSGRIEWLNCNTLISDYDVAKLHKEFYFYELDKREALPEIQVPSAVGEYIISREQLAQHERVVTEVYQIAQFRTVDEIDINSMSRYSTIWREAE